MNSIDEDRCSELPTALPSTVAGSVGVLPSQSSAFAPAAPAAAAVMTKEESGASPMPPPPQAAQRRPASARGWREGGGGGSGSGPALAGAGHDLSSPLTPRQPEDDGGVGGEPQQLEREAPMSAPAKLLGSGGSGSGSGPDDGVISGDEHEVYAGGASMEGEEVNNSSNGYVISRTPKVAKLRLSDHGSHGMLTPSAEAAAAAADLVDADDDAADAACKGGEGSNLLKRMTQSLTRTYDALGQRHFTPVNAAANASPDAHTAASAAVVPAAQQAAGGGMIRRRGSSSKKRTSPNIPLELEQSRRVASQGYHSTRQPLADASSTSAMSGIEAEESGAAGTGSTTASAKDPGHAAPAPAVAATARAPVGLLHAALQGSSAAAAPTAGGSSSASAAAPASSSKASAGVGRSDSKSGGSKSSARNSYYAALGVGQQGGKGPANSAQRSKPDRQQQQHDQQQQQMQQQQQQQNSNNSKEAPGTCLTNPSAPVSNGGADNAEGNLIVRVGDTISVPNRNVHVHNRRGRKNKGGQRRGSASSQFASPGRNRRSQSSGAIGGGIVGAPSNDDVVNVDDETVTEYRVLSLLGQGTFAQVFKCEVVTGGDRARGDERGTTVAVKVIKNKPAYTRQAAVEIDVFRALAEEVPTARGGTAGAAAATGTPQRSRSVTDSNRQEGPVRQRSDGILRSAEKALNDVDEEDGDDSDAKEMMAEAREGAAGGSDSGDGGGGEGGGADSMVNLLCYFMHKSHLCLVFELLGLNLYEVLKKRQFRGLPIKVVQSLVRQALEGVRDLSQRSVVHCDLKPENILLVDDEAIESVVNAGEHSAADNVHGGGGGGGGKQQQAAEQPLPQHPAPAPDASFLPADGSSSFSALASSPQPSSGRTSREATDTPGLVPTTPGPQSQPRIKLIDFGSACFEGQSAHTYIQSRFYRSPEVLVGLDYDSAIDMWSLGCVAAELFLGLPILPGVHEHDQLGRICEMIGEMPDWMMDKGSKASKYFVKFLPKSPPQLGVPQVGMEGSSPPPLRPAWRIKTREEYVRSLSSEEAKRRGGVSKLESQPTNRYFKRKRLGDIVELHGHCGSAEDKEITRLFVHFLKGILDPDPWERWTANQASMHPFITGSTLHQRGNDLGFGANDASMASLDNPSAAAAKELVRRQEIRWNPPWDPSICRRKLLCVQKAREKERAQLRGSRGSMTSTNLSQQRLPEGSATDAAVSALGNALNEFSSAARVQQPQIQAQLPSPGFTSRVTAMTNAMSLSQPIHSQPGVYQSPGGPLIHEGNSPPPTLGHAVGTTPMRSQSGLEGLNPTLRAGSLGTALGAIHYDPASGNLVESIAPSYYSANAASNLAQMQQAGAAGLLSAGGGLSSAIGAPSALQTDYPYDIPQVPLSTGAQSFSGVYYDRVTHQQMPLEGDLGYALQRPGVVPGMGGDPSLAAAVLQQQLTPLQYLQQQQQLQQQQIPPPPPTLGRAGSFTGPTPSSHAGARYNTVPRNSFSALSSSYTGIPQVPQSPGRQSLQMSAQFMDSPHSLRDAGMQLQQPSGTDSAPNNAPAPGTSLLAQQLAQHSATQGAMAAPDQNQNLGIQAQGIPPVQNLTEATYSLGQAGTYDGIASGNMGSYHGGGYYTYLSADGTPMMLSAPSNMDPRLSMLQPSALNYLQPSVTSGGSFQEGVPSQAAYNAQLLQQAQGMPYGTQIPQGGQQYAGPDTVNAVPPPPPPAPYRGMSM